MSVSQTRSAPQTQAPDYSPQSLIDRAESLLPVLRQRAQETSEARQIPESTINDFWNAGLFNLLKPKKFNGPEISPDIAFQIAALLARADGSAAWVWNLLTMHDLFAALLPLKAQEEYWSTEKSLGASSFAANGRATSTKDGFTLSGKWSFCSGVDCATWMLLGAKCNAAALNSPNPEIRWMLLPKSDCRIIDDWQVIGLRGTGSKSVAVNNAFVPEHRTIKYDELISGQSPGGKIHPSPLYRAPLWPIFTLGICAPATGIARGARDSFVQEMKSRVYGIDFSMQAKNPSVQLRLAEASALIDAAELLYQRSLKQIVGTIMTGQTPTQEDRIRSRRDQAYSVHLSKQAVELLLEAQGGKGLYETGHVQRALRDLHALSAHIMAGWDMPALNYGQVTLGGPPTDPYF